MILLFLILWRKNWVVMHGSEKVVREDVRNIGETIGVQFNGSNNMFGVLAKRGRGKKKDVVEREGGSKRSGKVASQVVCAKGSGVRVWEMKLVS